MQLELKLIWVDFKLPPDSDGCFVREDAIWSSLNRVLNSDTRAETYTQREIEAIEVLAMYDCEICDNGIDDDGDGYIDCYDLDYISINGGRQGDPGKSIKSEVWTSSQ